MWKPKFMQKYPYSRKELGKLFPDHPSYIIDFVYESFFIGAMVTLSYLGTDEFPTIMDEYGDFMTFLGQLSPERESDKALRDQLIREELQALLDAAQEPNA